MQKSSLSTAQNNEMKAIQEFISLLQKFGITTAEDLKIPFRNRSQTRQFFHILQNQVSPEEKGTNRHAIQSSSFDSFGQYTKRSLENHLVQTLFCIDIKKMGGTAHQRACYYCWKNLCAVKILLGQSAHHAAIRLTQKILQRAKKYQLSDLILESYKILRWYHGCVNLSRSKYQDYDHLLKEQRKVCEAEQVAEDYYSFLNSNYLTDKSQRFFLAEKARLYWKEISTLMAEFSSPRLHFLGYLIQVFHYSCMGNYQEALIANQRAVTFFETAGEHHSEYIIPFLNHQLACCIKLQNLKVGTGLVDKIAKHIKKGSFDWFVHRQLFFLLAMHSRNYELARQILHQTTSQRRFQYLDKPQAEKWIIYEAYLYYLKQMGYLKKEQKKSKIFQPKDLLIKVPLYAKDKRGMNVPILIISILILLAERRYNEVIDRLDALEKYRRRYLRMEDEYRSNCFIQMLTTLPKAYFHPKALARKAENYRNMLDRVPLTASSEAFELEIIPYEDLWEMVLESL